MIRIGVKVFSVCWWKTDTEFMSLEQKLERMISDWLSSFPIVQKDESMQVELVELVNSQYTISRDSHAEMAFVMIFYRYEVVKYELEVEM